MTDTSSVWVQQLKHPECYPHKVDHVRLIETHISWVLLTGSYAYKIKKPVKYSFVDFSTLDKRHQFCEEEVRLNKRLAPEVYLGVISIAGSPAHPSIGGQDNIFDYAVQMKQFLSDEEIEIFLTRSEKAEDYILRLADRIAQFHGRIEQADEQASYGNPTVVYKSMKECRDEIPLHLLTPDQQAHYPRIASWLRNEWRNLSDVLECRKDGGFVRECHGDLHLGNIVMFEGRVCVFDALEFEPRLRWIDVMSEVAFLVMDLEMHDCKGLAAVFLNRYLELTGDYKGLKVFRFYQVYRALVRAKVAGLRLAQFAERGQAEEQTKEELRGYLKLAHHYIALNSGALILMHGVSGTGKTTVSTEILKALGAIRLRSDVERKRLFGERKESTDSESQNIDLYHSDVTAYTYDRLRNLAAMLLQAGFVVIIDATFLQHNQRESFSMLASTLRGSCFIMDVYAPQAIVEERIARRSGEGRDASDATVDIMEQQQESEEVLTQEEKRNVIRVDSTDFKSIFHSIRTLEGKIRG